MATSRTHRSNSVKLLLENDKDTFIKAAEILLRISRNIIDNPKDEKYRRLRISNRMVSSLLAVSGGFQCLFDMGFEEAEEELILPLHSSVDQVKDLHDQLQVELDKRRRVPTGACPLSRLTSSSSTSNMDRAQQLMLSETQMYHKIISHMDQVKQYESTEAKRQALACIPVEELRVRVQRKLEAMGPDAEVDSRDLFLLELLHWFKNDFFAWMNSPKCHKCGGDTVSVGNTRPNPEELKWRADRVENYLCQACSTHTRFPRFNDPVKLLSTRVGRCGEWANCFTLCCRAVDFDARLINDFTDHAWTEVYSERQQRWLHCDPCENVCDKPLLYEAGWKKKLTYVLAFSRDDVQDVTWRYSANHKEVCSNRQLCRESWLLNLILKLRKQLQDPLPEERKTLLQNRLLSELVEFLSVKSVTDDEKSGRTSGSLAWRLARGETSPSEGKVTSKYVINPTEAERNSKLIHLQYCCASDTYTRGSDCHVTGWQSLVYEAENIFRKIENDWQMVYLARTEGSSTASITWKIDLQGTGLVVESVQIQALSKCFEDGCVSWRICADDQCAILPSDGKLTKIDNISGSSVLMLSATLSQGRGDMAWQHTQLFRQSLKDTNNPLDIKIYLKQGLSC